MPEIPISYPGRYAPGVAINFADTSGAALQVSQTSPLPVTLAATAPAPSPSALAGTTAAAITAGPFTPTLDKPMILALTGAWTGSVKLLRSTNGGTSKLPLSLAGSPWGVFTANACEPVWEESESAAVFYLQLAPASGSITYRLAQ